MVIFLVKRGDNAGKCYPLFILKIMHIWISKTLNVSLTVKDGTSVESLICLLIKNLTGIKIPLIRLELRKPWYDEGDNANYEYSFLANKDWRIKFNITVINNEGLSKREISKRNKMLNLASELKDAKKILTKGFFIDIQNQEFY